MFCSKFTVVACVIVLALVAGVANAGFIGTYVDATMENTEPSSAFSVTDSDTDNLWYLDTSRTYCEFGTVMVTQSDAETAPMLTTTVSGLANGAYSVYAVYWTHTDQAFAVDAAIAGGTTVACNLWTGTATGTSTEDKTQMYALLGQANVTDGSFAVTIVERDGNSRGWYDGVSYQAVPEPSTITLAIAGLLGLLAYAWRKRR
jgi:hypothetical protein